MFVALSDITNYSINLIITYFKQSLIMLLLNKVKYNKIKILQLKRRKELYIKLWNGLGLNIYLKLCWDLFSL